MSADRGSKRQRQNFQSLQLQTTRPADERVVNEEDRSFAHFPNISELDPSLRLRLGLGRDQLEAPKPFSPDVVNSSKKVVTELMSKGLVNLSNDEIHTLIPHLYVLLTRDTAPADLRENWFAICMDLPHQIQQLRKYAKIKERMANTAPKIEKSEADMERLCGVIAENEQKIKLYVAQIDALDNELNSADPSIGVICESETEPELQQIDNKIRKIPGSRSKV